MLLRIQWPTTGLALILAGTTHGEVMEFDDKNEWLAAVGDFATADFTGFEPGIVITDQYADLGVLFTDGNDRVWESQQAFPNDGVGLDGFGDITLVFDSPQAWIGVDFPGFLTIEIFSGGQLIHAGEFGASGIGNFGGLASTELFDMAILTAPLFEPNVDDLHFGVPAPGALVAFGLGVLYPKRRRECPAS